MPAAPLAARRLPEAATERWLRLTARTAHVAAAASAGAPPCAPYTRSSPVRQACQGAHCAKHSNKKEK
jgi:hypothetical protein